MKMRKKIMKMMIHFSNQLNNLILKIEVFIYKNFKNIKNNIKNK